MTAPARDWSDSQNRMRPRLAWSRPKLTPQQRDDIRARLADDASVQALALEFGVSVRTIYAMRP